MPYVWHAIKVWYVRSHGTTRLQWQPGHSGVTQRSIGSSPWKVPPAVVQSGRLSQEVRSAHRAPEHRLRHQRLLRGWSLETAAEELDKLAPLVGQKHLGVTASMFGKWERGIHQPRGVYRQLLCVLYEATAEELGFMPASPQEETLEDMRRRTFLQGLGAVTGAAVTSAGALATAVRRASPATPNRPPDRQRA